MISNLEMSIFILACGYFTWYKLTLGSFNNVSIILMIITGFDWLIMDSRVIDKIFGIKVQIDE